MPSLVLALVQAVQAASDGIVLIVVASPVAASLVAAAGYYRHGRHNALNYRPLVAVVATISKAHISLMLPSAHLHLAYPLSVLVLVLTVADISASAAIAVAGVVSSAAAAAAAASVAVAAACPFAAYSHRARKTPVRASEHCDASFSTSEQEVIFVSCS